MNLFDLSAKLSLDSSEYESGLSSAERGIQTLEGALKVFVFGAAVKKLTSLAKDAVNTGMAFDSAMSQVAATMGVTTDQIANLRDFAKEMGATTKFSAVESANALNYMALAGYDAEKSMKMLPTVLQLAAAGGMDLARASDMVTDAESALGLTTEQTATMVDQMARAASRSNTSVEQLGDAMLTIGGTAKFMAGGTDRLQTVLGLLADNGIKGSEAGTKLRNILLKLSSPTKDGAEIMEALGVSIFDTQGKMRDMQDIMLDLNAAMSTLTEQDKVQALSEIFNARDLSAVNALLGTSKERWDELGASIAEAQGSAGKMATTQLGNLTGDITIMKSALEGVKIEFAEGITPALQDVVKRITKVLSNPKTQKFLRDVGEALGKVIKRITEIVSNVVLPRLISLFEDGGKKIKTFGAIALGLVGTIKTVSTVLGVLAGTVSPTGLLIKGVGMLLGLFTALDIAEDDYIQNKRYLTDAERELVDAIDEANAAHQETVDAYQDSALATLEEKKRVEDLWKELQNLTDENGNVRYGMEKRADFILHELNEALGTEYTLNGNVIEQYQQMQTEIDNLIAKKAAEAMFLAKEEEYNQAIEKRREALEEVGRAYKILSEAENELSGYEKELVELHRIQESEYAKYGYATTAAAEALERELEIENDLIPALKLKRDEYQRTYEVASETARSQQRIIEDYNQATVAMYEKRYTEVEEILTREYDYQLELQRKRALYDREEEARYKDMLESKRYAIEAYRRDVFEGQKGYHVEYLEELIREYNAEVEEARKAGLNVGTSLGIGLAESKSGVIAKAGRLMKDAIKEMRVVAQIASPSKLGRAIGRNVGGSVGIGLDDSYDDVLRSADDLMNGTFDVLDQDYKRDVGYLKKSQGVGNLDSVLSVLRDIRDNIGNEIVMQDGTLVGWMDKQLGRIAAQKVRGTA